MVIRWKYLEAPLIAINYEFLKTYLLSNSEAFGQVISDMKMKCENFPNDENDLFNTFGQTS